MTEDFLTLTEGFPCFFLSCKANARIKLANRGHGPHYSKLVIICVVLLLLVLFHVLFVCKCVLYYCHRVTTQLQLTNIISYHTINHISCHISHQVKSSQIKSNQVMSCHIIYHIIYHIYHIIYHIISYIISYHISYHIIYNISYIIYYILYIIYDIYHISYHIVSYIISYSI